MRKYEKKSERSEKVHASIKKGKLCLYQEKWLKFNTRGILNSRAKEIRYFGPLMAWKRSENLQYVTVK